MNALIRSIRRVLIRWQLRNLDEQAKYIVEARHHARLRLQEIWHERDAKRIQLHSNAMRSDH